MGHALQTTLQDLLTRWKRMQGYNALWVPGTDHAGIATQLMVERQLAAEGTSRQELGRERFLARVWAWKERYHDNIRRQLSQLGASCDWSRERFTLDEGLSRAVREAFVRLYREGAITRGEYMVNWSPVLGTAISDLEVESRSRSSGKLYHVAYPVEGSDGADRGGHHPAGDHARRHRGRPPPRRRALPAPGRQGGGPAAGRAAAAVRRRPGGRAGVRHRAGQDHPLPRPGRLRAGEAPRPAGDPRHRPPRADDRGSRGGVRRPRPRGGPPAGRRAAARRGFPGQGRGLHPQRRPQPAQRRADRAAGLHPVVLRRRRPMAERALGAVGARRADAGARDVGQDLGALARQHPPLVHLAPALVGAPDPRLVRRRGALLRRPRRRRGGAAAGVAAGRPDPGSRRPRHLVLLGAVAVLHPRLAGRHRRPGDVLSRPTSWSPATTSSSSGSPAW